jgi:hypothetical protein
MFMAQKHDDQFGAKSKYGHGMESEKAAFD